MIFDLIESGQWLPYVFVFLMGLSMLIYAVLDGYDLGVGILMPFGKSDEKDKMIASIGPFWDANETWLVLGVGILLTAFPMAHGMILTNLYLPAFVMLLGLIFRGVAFDFRAKVHTDKKARWDWTFFGGSFLTALAQGYMLGSYILGFRSDLSAILFSLFTGVCVAAGYCLIGSSWLIMKTEGDLQKKSVKWARLSVWAACLGIVFISLLAPLVSERIFEKWFAWPEIFMLAPIPFMTGALVFALWFVLRKLPTPNDNFSWLPFLLTIGLYVLSFYGLAYSFYPYIVPDRLLVTEAAAAPESLLIILFGALIVLPVLLGYTAVSYYIFRGKASDLRYD
jgi:cytochrome bd ubiquinol oxidase subunit II